jgi:8-oxo-dGTP pyrophosphatase MutT (NUDIX family)
VAVVSSAFEQTASEVAFEGRLATVLHRRFRHEDGQEVEREIVSHPGAVGIVAHDGERLWLVRQPREAIDSPDLLEIPAGKLDEPDEDPLETARRELAEEIGKAADHWEPLTAFHTSPGFTDELVHLFLASGLRDVERPAVEEDERIEIVTRPLAAIDEVIGETTDSKTLIGLLLLRGRL